MKQDYRTSINLQQSELEKIRKFKLDYMHHNNITNLTDKRYILEACSMIDKAIKIKQV